MSHPTFFPAPVDRALDRLENAVEGGFESEVVNDAHVLTVELRRWEREWRDGKARLVPQTPEMNLP